MISDQLVMSAPVTELKMSTFRLCYRLPNPRLNVYINLFSKHLLVMYCVCVWPLVKYKIDTKMEKAQFLHQSS